MTEFIEKIKDLGVGFTDPEIARQVAEVELLDSVVQGQRLLASAPGKLGLSDRKMGELSWEMSDEDYSRLKTLNKLFNNVRQYLSLQYGIWSVPNFETANLLKEELGVETALEVMAGNAYWSKALSDAGVQVWATDSLEWAKTSQTGSKPFYRVEDLSADQAVKKYATVDLILCSWAPNFGQADLDLIQARQYYAPRAKLVFIGEKNGATNSAEFWQKTKFVKSDSLKKINRSFKSYDFIKEQIFEVKQ